MDINRCNLSTVFLFAIAIFFWFLPLSIQASSRGIKVISDLSHQSNKLGTYRALIIGINYYKDPEIPDLKTAVSDAKSMAEILQERYGFQVQLLLNQKATKKAIYQALRNLALSAEPDDSVLIYYAGHGDLDRTYNDGWWIPTDAKGGDPITYLDNVQVQKSMRSMQARHVLLISDSCYSGTLFGQARAIPQVIDDKYYLNLYNEKSRWAMTSGNKTPVADDGTGGHSVFAYQLLKVLRKNEKPYISTQELYTRIAPIISNNSEQTPLCRPVRNTGDQGGEFVFVASSAAVVEEPASEKLKASLSVDSNVSGARVFVDGQGVGSTNLLNVKVSPGEHRIRVEKDGYEAYTKRIHFDAGRSISLYVDLTRKIPTKGRLYVETRPNNARVRILNIGPKFYQGMELKEGRYHVEVSADGYVSKESWVTLKFGEDKSINVWLTKKTVSLAVSGTEQCDQFNHRKLASEWRWVREDQARWSLNERPGHLRIYTQRGEIWGGSNQHPRSNNLKNLLLRPAPSGDFWITTKVDFSPKYFHHAAAIVIYQDDDNYIRLSRQYLSQSLQFVREIRGKKHDIRVPVDLTTTYLKIAKKGNLFIAYYGTDGTGWSKVGEFSARLNNLRIGLYAASGLYEAGRPYGQIPADFDFFCIGGQSIKHDQARLYTASGKVKQSWPFAGGSSCCGCRIEHYGTLPTDFPRREVSAVTFYLTGSRSNSYYKRIKSGPNRLNLMMGNRRSTALSRELSAVKTLPVKHKWLLTFKFEPPILAEPGMTWRLLDGDNNIYSAVLLHASDQATADDKANALPGKYKTSSCRYARVDDVWYSVKFDFVPR